MDQERYVKALEYELSVTDKSKTERVKAIKAELDRARGGDRGPAPERATSKPEAATPTRKTTRTRSKKES